MKINITLCLMLITFHAFAKVPWFTGPLLANSGTNVPANELVTEFYQFYLANEGEYLRHQILPSTGAKISDISLISSTLGLTDRVDVEIMANFNHNVNDTQKHDNIGDTNVLLGLQLLKQRHSIELPNIRFTLQETIPTGRYSNLNPISNGTDASGLGSYQTNMGINFSYLCEPFLGHQLQTTLNLNYLYAQSAQLYAHNIYGGTAQTSGKVNPGNLKSLDFAMEFSITRHIVLVLETYMYKREAERFSGTVGVHSNGLAGYIGDGLPNTQYTLAPAVEVHFNKNFGVIGGYWYSLGGNNSSVFHAPTIALIYTLD